MRNTIQLSKASPDNLEYWAETIRSDAEGSRWLNFYTDHNKWASTQGATRYVLTATCDGVEVGFVEIDILSNYTDTHLTYYIHPNHRGKRFGSSLLNETVKWVRENTKLKVLFGYVEHANMRSRRAFDRTNFLDQGRNKDHYIYTYVIHR